MRVKYCYTTSNAANNAAAVDRHQTDGSLTTSGIPKAAREAHLPYRPGDARNGQKWRKQHLPALSHSRGWHRQLQVLIPEMDARGLAAPNRLIAR